MGVAPWSRYLSFGSNGKRSMKSAVHIHLMIEDARWRARDGASRLVRRAARTTLRRQARGLRTAELGLVLADDRRLRTLNRTWRGIDKATNVLAFPADDGSTGDALGSPPRQLGDVVVAYETIATEARAQGKSFEAHLTHLIVHGVLHLLGFDHATASEAADMEAVEIAIMAELGWPDPYRTASTSRRGARALARVA